MQLPLERKGKLERYYSNADPFFFNLLESKNKKKRIAELKSRGLLKGYSAGSNPTYNKINQDLLVELGIEGVLDIVVERVNHLFRPDDLQYFRRCWEQSQTPSLKYLMDQHLYRTHVFTSNETRDEIGFSPVVGYKEPAFVFVQIDTQHNFVERWTVFAGLWFEEIEPLLAASQLNTNNS
jgi:DNA-binding Lrp family transcriptional regulator